MYLEQVLVALNCIREEGGRDEKEGRTAFEGGGGEGGKGRAELMFFGSLCCVLFLLLLV